MQLFGRYFEEFEDILPPSHGNSCIRLDPAISPKFGNQVGYLLGLKCSSMYCLSITIYWLTSLKAFFLSTFWHPCELSFFNVTKKDRSAQIRWTWLPRRCVGSFRKKFRASKLTNVAIVHYFFIDAGDVLAFRKNIRASTSSSKTGWGCTNNLPEGKYILQIFHALISMLQR